MQNRGKYYIYGGVLAIAVIALLVDRVTRQGPASAEAAVEAPDPQTDEPSKAAAPAVAAPKNRGKEAPAPDPNTASTWLSQLPEVPKVRDLFADTNVAPPVQTEAEENEGSETKGKGVADPAESFLEAHRLHATYKDKRTSFAIVDGRLIHPGQSIDGFQLISVDAFQATFKSGRHQVVLPLPKSDETQTASSPDTDTTSSNSRQ